MKFHVKFLSTYNHAIEKDREYFGTIGIDQIRNELALPDLPIDIIDNAIYSVYSDPEIVISEKLARASKLFENETLIKIYVPAKFLNSYVHKTVISQKEENGAVTMAKIIFKIDKAEILKMWEDKGFPETFENEKTN